MENFVWIIFFLSVFGTHSAFGLLKCRCSNVPTSPCNADGTCTVDKGVCAIVQAVGTGIQRQCMQMNDTSTGCVKTSMGGFASIQCTCNHKDFCNDNLTQTDFGVRSNATLKCNCSTGQSGCDSGGTCLTAGICVRTTQTGADIQHCSDKGGYIGCLKTKYSSGQESTTCGCEYKDYCNKSSDKKFILSLLFVLLSFGFLFNRF